MTAKEIHDIARMKPVLTETELNDDLTDKDMESMVNDAWDKSQRLSASKCQQTNKNSCKRK